jgi:hypothetical protein
MCEVGRCRCVRWGIDVDRMRGSRCRAGGFGDAVWARGLAVECGVSCGVVRCGIVGAVISCGAVPR